MPTLILLSNVVMLLKMRVNNKNHLQFHYYFLHMKIDIELEGACGKIDYVNLSIECAECKLIMVGSDSLTGF